MNIGEVAAISGVSAKKIRHYESIGLLPQPGRTDAGYRRYNDKDVARLRFIRHCRDLGFGLDQVGELLDLWQNRERSSRQVKALAQAHLAELDAKLRELQQMRTALESLVSCCHGDERPDCPIIESLEAAEETAAPPAVASSRASPPVKRRHLAR